MKRSEGTKSTPYTERMNLLRESLKDRSEKRLVELQTTIEQLKLNVDKETSLGIALVIIRRLQAEIGK